VYHLPETFEQRWLYEHGVGTNKSYERPKSTDKTGDYDSLTYEGSGVLLEFRGPPYNSKHVPQDFCETWVP